MATTVKITTTTTSNSNAYILNTGYLKTVPGILKLCELVLGIVSVGITAYNYDARSTNESTLFFLLMAVTFMICTFCLLASCLVSWTTGGLISKTMFELVYHAVATGLLLIASLVLLVSVSNNQFWRPSYYDALMAAAVIGLVNSILYLASSVLAQRSYRGI